MAASEPLSIRQLEVFVALVDQGSFTRAAKHLGLSQSTVSGHMADLEKRLRVRLVGRERTGARPTAAGQALLGPARQALRAEVHARMAAQEFLGLLRGSLVVGASTIPAEYLMPRWLAAYRERHPDIALEVRATDSDAVIRRVAEGELDVGVAGRAPAQRGVVGTEVARDRLVLAMPPDHALAGAARVPLDALAQHDFVVREKGSGTQRAIDDLLDARLDGAALPVACRMGSTSAIRAAVREGLGLAFLSARAVAEDVAAGRLAAADVQDLALERGLHLVHRREDELSPAARAFVALVREMPA